MKKKDLQNILSNHDQSYQSLQQSLNIYTNKSVAGNQRNKFDRAQNRLDGKNKERALRGMNSTAQEGNHGESSVLAGSLAANGSDGGNILTPLKGSKDMGSPGSSLMRGNHGQMLLNNVVGQGGSYGNK